ncbi:MAG: lysophospholipase [Bdellovibrionia bacterium]
MVRQAVWALQESEIFAKLQTEVEPFFETGIAGTFLGKDQVELAYRTFVLENEKAALVLLPGRGEPIHKYAEVVYDLRVLGLSIYILEHRGQGESDLVEGVRSQFVQSYDDYVEDLDTFVRTVVKAKAHSKLFLLGHSMGGAIGTLYAAKYPGVLNGLILSAPMFDMNTPPYSKKTARRLAQFICSIGMGKWTAAKDSFQVTSSQARNEMNIQVADKYSKVQWRNISYRWVLASLNALDAVQECSHKLTLPILLLQAERDLHVPAEGQNRFCRNVASCEKVVVPNSFHEPLMETDSIRNLSLAKIKKFTTSLLSSND